MPKPIGDGLGNSENRVYEFLVPQRFHKVTICSIVHHVYHPHARWYISKRNVRLLATIEKQNIGRLLFEPGDQAGWDIRIGGCRIQTFNADGSKFERVFSGAKTKSNVTSQPKVRLDGSRPAPPILCRRPDRREPTTSHVAQLWTSVSQVADFFHSLHPGGILRLDPFELAVLAKTMDSISMSADFARSLHGTKPG